MYLSELAVQCCIYATERLRRNDENQRNIFTGIFFQTDLSVPPCKTSFEPRLSRQVLLIPATHPAAFPPSVCNIHLGERCRDETHILMLTRTLPRALFTTSVTYHQIKSAW